VKTLAVQQKTVIHLEINVIYYGSLSIFFYNMCNITCYIAEYLKQIMDKQEKLTRTQTASNIMLRDLKQWANRIEDVIKSRAPVLTKTNYSLIAEILPLRTVQAIKDFDSLLHDSDEAVTQFVSFYINLSII